MFVVREQQSSPVGFIYAYFPYLEVAIYTSPAFPCARVVPEPALEPQPDSCPAAGCLAGRPWIPQPLAGFIHPSVPGEGVCIQLEHQPSSLPSPEEDEGAKLAPHGTKALHLGQESQLAVGDSSTGALSSIGLRPLHGASRGWPCMDVLDSLTPSTGTNPALSTSFSAPRPFAHP